MFRLPRIKVIQHLPNKLRCRVIKPLAIVAKAKIHTHVTADLNGVKLISLKDAYVWRGTETAPETLKARNGFLAWGTNLNLADHFFQLGNSSYTSTSQRLNIAAQFAAKYKYGGYVYKALMPEIFCDVRKMPPRYFSKKTGVDREPSTNQIEEVEIAAACRIPYKDIAKSMHILPFYRDGLPWVLNPDFCIRDYCIEVLSKCPEEAKEIQKDFVDSNPANSKLIYPSYAAALQLSKALREIHFTTAPEQMCHITAVNRDILLKALNLKPDSQVSDGQLATYYLNQYLLTQKELNRQRAPAPVVSTGIFKVGKMDSAPANTNAAATKLAKKG